MSNRAYEILASLSYKKLKFQQKYQIPYLTAVVNKWHLMLSARVAALVNKKLLLLIEDYSCHYNSREILLSCRNSLINENCT